MPRENSLHILLVDDDATDRELFKDAIGLLGNKYQLTEAADGQEAMNFLLSTESLPDLVILDLNMPVKDGRETLRDIRKQETTRAIPVCIMSTSSAHFDLKNAYSDGANLFLVKPFDFNKLLEMLSSLLTLFSKHVSLLRHEKV